MHEQKEQRNRKEKRKLKMMFIAASSGGAVSISKSVVYDTITNGKKQKARPKGVNLKVRNS